MANETDALFVGHSIVPATFRELAARHVRHGLSACFTDFVKIIVMAADIVNEHSAIFAAHQIFGVL